MNTIERWKCGKCQRVVASEFCPDCGEARIKPVDLSLRHLMGQVYRSFSSLDSKLLRTFRALMFSPGALANAYLHGPRKPFIAPFQLFLICNVAFFAVQSWASIKIFSTPLSSHLRHQDWSEFARRLVADKLAAQHLNLAQYATQFDRAAALNAKSMVILMTLPFALVLLALFSRTDRPPVTHLVFALHFYAFELIVLSILLLFTVLDTWVGGPSPGSTAMDLALFAALLLAAAIYIGVAIERVYGTRGLSRIAAAAGLTLTVGAGVLFYRFVVFLITLYST